MIVLTFQEFICKNYFCILNGWCKNAGMMIDKHRAYIQRLQFNIHILL